MSHFPHMVFSNDGTSEQQYLQLVEYIMKNGDDRDDRTGTGTRAIHGATLRFDLSDGTLPLLTTKFVPYKAVFHELNWMLSGNTNIQALLQNKVTIWSDWPYAKYIKETGDTITMKDFEKRIVNEDNFAQQWGSIGPGYGHQWRLWQGPDGKVYDQISDLVERIKTDPSSRRLLFHGWNVADLDKMALPPCHLLYQFYVAKGTLSLTMYQRSCDVGLGLPFNIASCALLLNLMAQQCNLKVGQLFWVGHDVHLYINHLDKIGVQLDRTPKAFPKITIEKASSLFDYKIDDVHIEGYDPHPAIRMDVAV